MGYNLGFGNFKADIEPEYRSVYLTVEGIDPLPEDAPYTSAGNGSRSNWTWPSYGGWSTFTEKYDLYDVFYGIDAGRAYWKDDEDEEHDALLMCHPGAVAIEPIHLKRFTEALEKAPMSYEEAALALEKEIEWAKSATQKERLDKEFNCNVDLYDTLRLNWLVYWTKWVLENCEYPTFANS